MSGKGGAQKLTVFYIEQQLKPEFWSWASDPTLAARFFDTLPPTDASAAEWHEYAAGFGELLVQALEGDGLKIAELHIIVHNHDLVSEGVVKEPHVHVIGKFEGGRKGGATEDTIAQPVGIESQYVERPRKGGRSVEGRSQSHDNKLAYLTHVKYVDDWPYPHPYDAAVAHDVVVALAGAEYVEGKAPYDPGQVATVRGQDYVEIYDKRLPDWLKGRAYIKAEAAKVELEWFREEVLQGRITKQQIMLTDGYYDIYSRNQRVIDEALSAYGERRAYRAADKLRNGEFSTQVVYVHGPAGIGKTRFARQLVEEALTRAAAQGENWALYRAATANPLDDWQGEEIVLLDDLRASAMDANDWLLLLDPYNASPARARYRNKAEVAPRMIVITATIEPVEFFFYARQKGQVDEALDQFIRRLASVVHVFRADDIERFVVAEIGQVPPYPRQLQTKDAKGIARVEVLELGYGPTATVEHSASGAVAALMLDLARRTKDVPFGTSEDWSVVQGTVVEEVEIHQRRCAEDEARRAALRDAAQDREIARLQRQLAQAPAEMEAATQRRAEQEQLQKERDLERSRRNLAARGFVFDTRVH